MAIEWQEEWVTDDDRIDAEHIELLSNVNDILNLLNAGASPIAISSSIQMLIRKSDSHFSYEEDLMSKSDYSDAAIHHDEHQRLLCAANIMASDLLIIDGGIDIVGIGKFLESWFTGHIERDDLPFFDYLSDHKTKGIY
jgi:hemerythrin-like metal-binding protein